MQRVLFVCLGNICRSPLAEGIAKAYIQKHSLQIECESCGTSSFHEGEHPCPNSIKVAKQHGIDISMQHSRPITPQDFENFDYIVALDESNRADLLSMGVMQEKITKLGDYGYKGEDVPDPYFFNGFEGFERVFSMVESCVHELLEKIQDKVKGR